MNPFDENETQHSSQEQGGPFEVVFHIPPLPQLHKLPEPKPVKKAPVAGYDVKTLKRQVDFLRTEIEERDKAHKEVYNQNLKMWDYIQNLIDVAHNNADKMKEHVSLLHADIEAMNLERKELAEKVALARDSKALLQQIHKSLGNLKFSHDEMGRIHQQADQSLQAVRSENKVLEDSLHKKVAEMQLMRWKLDENENREKYEAMLATADHFWKNSRVVLRNAFYRFTQGIGRRIRLSNVYSLLHHTYLRHLKEKHFWLYKEFMSRKRIMWKAQRRRANEALLYYFMKLKLYHVMETVHNKARRRVLLRKCFRGWKQQYKNETFEKWSMSAISSFQDRKFIRRFFKAWKGRVVFLEWNSRETAQLEWRAIRHFVGQVLRAWRALLPLAHKHMRSQLHQTALLVRKRLFFDWKRSCRALWQRRGMLLLRFFRNLRRINETDVLVKKAMARAAHIYMYLSLRRFRSRLLLTKQERSVKRRLRAVPALLSSHMRSYDNMFKELYLFSVVSKRGKVSIKAAQEFSRAYPKRAALRKWHYNASITAARRRLEEATLKRNGLTHWMAYAVSIRAHNKALARLTGFLARKRATSRRRALAIWAEAAKTNRVLRSLYNQTRRKLSLASSRRLFVAWRCSWSKRMYWALREQQIEAARQDALVRLKMSEISDLTQNHSELRDLAAEHADKVKELEARRDDKEKELINVQNAYEKRNAEKKQLEHEMKLLLEKLKHSERERNKLKSTETMLVAQAEREKEILRERKAHADQLLETMRAEAKLLERDVYEARQQSKATESQVLQEIKDGVQLVKERKAKSMELKELLETRRAEDHALTRDRQDVLVALEKLQKRLDVMVGRDTPQVVEEANILRARTSEHMELSSSAALAEARVAELARIVEEMEVPDEPTF